MLTLLAFAALAYETDQLTDRDVPLADAMPVADAWMNDAVDTAIRRTNHATQCKLPLDRTHRVLAHELVELTGRRQRLAGRGFFHQFGYGSYSAWLESKAPIERREFTDRQDVFGGIGAGQSLVLHFAGPCSTIRLGSVLLGTDKLDHFLDTGYHYFIDALGSGPDRALLWSTRTERTYYGLWTSKAFSFGDLAANHAGFQFYSGLLGPGSIVQTGSDGCLVQTRSWSWSEWVTDAWDEVLNPSVYAPRVDVAVKEHIAAERDRYCAVWRALGPDYETRLSQTLQSPVPYAAGRVPTRVDPFGLGGLCGG